MYTVQLSMGGGETAIDQRKSVFHHTPGYNQQYFINNSFIQGGLKTI